MELADKICNNAIEICRYKKWNDFSVAVVDQAGNPIVTKKMDGCTSPDIPKYATAKAYTCIASYMSSRDFRDKYTGDNNPGRYC